MTAAITPIDVSTENARLKAEINALRREAGYFSSTAAVPRRFRVKSEQTDHLVCRTYDGTDEGTTDVNVAKPPNLRGHIASRPAGGETEDIFPAYAVNGDIWADLPAGGTGVALAGVPVVWLDKNNDARGWTIERDCGA